MALREENPYLQTFRFPVARLWGTISTVYNKLSKGNDRFTMIHITKSEALLLRELFPEYTVTRTMTQDSKRHHYYATEAEELMRAIADTNQRAAELTAEFDRIQQLKRQRQSASS